MGPPIFRGKTVSILSRHASSPSCNVHAHVGGITPIQRGWQRFVTSSENCGRTLIRSELRMARGTVRLRMRRGTCKWGIDMQRCVLALAAAACLDFCLAYSAAAADMPVKAPIVPLVAPPAYDWSGPYLGTDFGGSWSNGTANIAGVAWDPGATAFIGGFELGYNWQRGNILVGVEGDFDGSVFDRPPALLPTSLRAGPGFRPSRLDQYPRSTRWTDVRQVAGLRQGRWRLGPRQRNAEPPQWNELERFEHERRLAAWGRDRIRV
jgi:hypothetical protein